MECQIKNKETKIEFQVVDEEAPAALGLPTLIQLYLIQRIDAIEKENTYLKKLKQNGLLKGNGKISDYEYNIKLEADAIPIIEPCRRVAVNLMEPLKKELQKMVELKVIEKVEEPTKWVNSLVIVKKKDGGLRVCFDPQHLNKAIQREHYYIPRFEDLCSKMSGAKVFSTLDADRAFWQVKLSKESSFYTTFNTPFGRYKFLRMPYGICSAPKVFHHPFEDMEGVETYIDDILVWGKNEQQHRERLELVLKRTLVLCARNLV